MNAALAGRIGRWLLLVAPPSGLVVLELLHPTWDGGTVYQAVAPVVDWWIALHLILMVLFALVALVLFLTVMHLKSTAALTVRLALGLFVVGNSAFIGIDGIATGLMIRGVQTLSPAEQSGVEQALQALWNSPVNELLARWQWLAWVVGIGAAALALYPSARGRTLLAVVGFGLLLVIAGGLGLDLDLGVPGWSLGIVAAVAAAAVVAARHGATTAGQFGLLLLAAVLPQHGSPPGAIGVGCLGLALVWRELSGQLSTIRPPVLAPPEAARAA